jgi:hypothetical protein
MPIFGEYETIGEPIAVTEYRHHTTTVWRARKLGSGAEATFAIKSFVPHRVAGTERAEQEALDKDHALEFLEGVKQLKKAHSEGGRCLAAVHAMGYADDGTWYATDYYPRNTLKAWIARRGSMDDAALAQVVRCISAAALALKRSRGYSHGNLKPSNIYLVGKPRPLRQTPLELGDIYPSGTAPLGRLEERSNQEAKELLGSVMEVQDLRALGELILQLVEGRLVTSAYDYNYPIAASPAWERLGRQANRWRDLCNQLLDPQLSLTKINFESLARDFQPSTFAVHRTKIFIGAGAVCLLAVGIFVGMQLMERARVQREKARNEKFAVLLKESRAALEQDDYTAALTKTKEALELKPNAGEATELKAQVEQKFEAAYQRELTAARQALAAERFDEVERAASRALQLRQGDKAANDVMKEAQVRRNAKLSKKEQDENYMAAINAANIALAKDDYPGALTEINRALGYRANDAEALRLQAQAEREQRAARERADRERDYGVAMQTGRAALRDKDFEKAKREAERALGYKANDGPAMELAASAEAGLRTAREQAELERKYQQATNASGVALARNDFGTAIAEADRALGLRTNDVVALKLKTAAQQGQANAKAQAELDRNYKEAVMAARTALNQRDFAKAKSEVARALTLRTNDAPALELKAQIETAQQAALAQEEQDRNYKLAIEAAQAARAKSDFKTMLAEANRALTFRANDKPAQDLKTAAEQGLKLAAEQAQRDQNYRDALTAAEQALAKKDYADALAQANRALTFRANDKAALAVKDQAEKALEAIRTQAQRAQTYQQAMTAASNSWARAEAAFEKLSYDQALLEVTNTLKQFQVARANGEATAVEPLEKELKKRQTDIQREQGEGNQFLGLIKVVKQALQTNNLALAEQRLGTVQELAQTNGLSGREYVIRVSREAGLRAIEKDYREAQEKWRAGIVAWLEAERPDYAKARDAAKVSKAFADLTERIKTEQPVWEKSVEQFTQGKYDFMDSLATGALAQKLPFSKLLTQAEAEKKQLAVVKQAQADLQGGARTNDKWQSLRDSLKGLAVETKQKPPFAEVIKWLAENDPVNALQFEVDLYKVWFKVGNYRRDMTYQGQKVVPIEGNIPRQNQEAYAKRVAGIQQAFKDAGLATPERDRELEALKQAIENWNR